MRREPRVGDVVMVEWADGEWAIAICSGLFGPTCTGKKIPLFSSGDDDWMLGPTENQITILQRGER